MDNNQENIQQKLFDHISKILPPSVSQVDILAETLNISVDSAYRRLRGETFLNIYEISALCKRFNLSFDSLCENTGRTVTFDFSPLSDEISYKQYLTEILEALKIINAATNKQIIYAAEDIPLFHNFRFPLLGMFKLFYWMKAVMNVESLQGAKFDSSILSNEILTIGKEIYNHYARIPSIEIWTEITPVSLFKQIEFFWESGVFKSQDDALALCDQVKEELALLEKQAAIGKKYDTEGNLISDENSYMLYWSEIEIGNNCILVEIENTKSVYITFNTFNKLLTRNNSFCAEIDKWLKNLIKKSNLISDVSEKQRYLFFKKLNSMLDDLTNKIKE